MVALNAFTWYLTVSKRYCFSSSVVPFSVYFPGKMAPVLKVVLQYVHVYTGGGGDFLYTLPVYHCHPLYIHTLTVCTTPLVYCRLPAGWGLQQTTRALGSDKTRGQGSFGSFTGGLNLTPTGELPTCVHQDSTGF